MFRKVLVANRGEIAVRVIRTCRELGIATVAVYSEVDRKALHVLRADEACLIGPAPASESYLRIDRIIDAAKHSGAEAIHPGYGFLAENPALARACRQAGIAFIGPSAEAMELMGSKTRARHTVRAAGVPVVPGSESGIDNLEDALAMAGQFGYPVMVKAAAGGGGKGLRLVRNAQELHSAIREARSEALNAFGDSEVYLEKYLERPRHIEIQVLGDQHGNMVYLGERECSIQRRHQKVVEECPSPFVDADMRRRMGEAAVCAASAAGYYNAGTVEFLVDPATRNFYFLEMNARLQVEHPVTEIVTGLDLVKLQLAVAGGERLPFDQQRAMAGWRGAALECRIYAEDPDNNFFPSPGTITTLVPPGGPGVRADSGVYHGWTVPLEYDPLISKIITWGEDRQEAILRMRRVLDEYFIGGIKTTIPFFKRLLENPRFLEGRLDTGLLDDLLAQPLKPAGDEKALEAAAIAAAFYSASRNSPPPQAPSRGSQSNWKREGRRALLR
jgi:acetyl-CoA carboxylase biotin carboxylase subunit